MLLAIVGIIGMLVDLVVFIIIVQMVISLLLAFNVISQSNEFVRGLYHALNAILDPVLQPIRKILPDTGMIDLSPIVLIFGMKAVQMLLIGVATSTGGI
ncbi:YggT family protein [Sphingorhabdus lutea]|uniref:YggT family protein n=1 Tax=Sphingorhabdus lutea TaxID=1913578 RepID=A0A1L3J9L9_9SPHN|nr:YggT family protein [Sphingorhabdus lutea]APG61842.1 YggT family protein [Sphingorhabdus lutea]